MIKKKSTKNARRKALSDLLLIQLTACKFFGPKMSDKTKKWILSTLSHLLLTEQSASKKFLKNKKINKKTLNKNP